MIVTVTPNPAWDVTYRTPVLRPGEPHRVTVQAEHAGGKGVNTAGVLTAMGVPCVVVAPVGRESLPAFTADLDARGVPHRLVEVPGAVRRAAVVVDDAGESTVLNEVGHPLPAGTDAGLLAAASRDLRPGDVVTVSGSLPPDGDRGLVARLTRSAHAAGARVVLDVRGPALLAALAEGPDVVKPNRSEAAGTLDEPDADAASLAAALVARGARVAVVSDGEAGLVLVHGSVTRRARGDRVSGNATGAGDALTAALAASLDGRTDLPDDDDGWSEVLRRAVAWSGAAVLHAAGGDVDPADVARLTPRVRVDRVG